MIRWLLRRKIRAFERQFDYDMSYARDILNVDLGAMWYLSVIANAANYRKELPLDVWYAAKISAARYADCGACTQLVVSMAEQEGIAADNLRAILAEEGQAMTPDAALGSRFARSVLSRNVVEADALRGEVLRRWGKRGLDSLALGISSSIVFPHLKYALGYGRSCAEIRVMGTGMKLKERGSRA